MELAADLLKLLIPASLVLYGMYLTVRLLLQRDSERLRQEERNHYTDAVVPIRLQAYERIILFLERISPNNLLVRLGGTTTNALDFQQRLLSDIRDEYNHNLSQQIYMSQPVWSQVQQAMNDTVTIINQAAAGIQPDAPPIELSKRIFERIIQHDQQPTSKAIRAVKEEIQAVFMEK